MKEIRKNERKKERKKNPKTCDMIKWIIYRLNCMCAGVNEDIVFSCRKL